jgi:hypothetical protein
MAKKESDKKALKAIDKAVKRAMKNGVTGGLVDQTVATAIHAATVKFAGREWDHALLRELPGGVDPCGGEWRVPLVCLGGAYVCGGDSGGGWRKGGAGGICLCGAAGAGLKMVRA